MLPNEIVFEIMNLNSSKKVFKPHKYVALLAAIRILRENDFEDNKVYYTKKFRDVFSEIFSKYSTGNDRNRPYTPFFHLRSTSFWRLIPKPNREYELENASTVGGPAALVEIVEYAELSNSFMAMLRNKEDCLHLEKIILNNLDASFPTHLERDLKDSAFSVNTPNTIDGNDFSNPFVGYLSSLQRIGGGNENALAESQSCNEQFSYIHVSHPLTTRILEELKNNNGKNVILTGHAGDGKSTIAIEVYKSLTGILLNEPLLKPLKPREDIRDERVSIIKDLSERHKAEDSAFLKDLSSGAHRFLLVTNTGTLLDLFRSSAADFDLSKVKAEELVLDAISDERGEGFLKFGNAEFLVFNMARMDNLHVARQIFEKMLSAERWDLCSKRDCQANCPIYLNVRLIRNNQQRVIDRIFLAYRRMYEYGTRLTMRQLTEHLAYLVTSGLEEVDIKEMWQQGKVPPLGEYMFFNRFFGDTGREDHDPALQMQAIKEIRQQGFGQRPCPTWERKLWLRSKQPQFKINVPDCEATFGILLGRGARSGNHFSSGVSSDQAREQVRRMLFFLYDFQAEDTYLSHYLNSPMIQRWGRWQKSEVWENHTEKSSLAQRVFHVLQEHFTGVRLPEGTTQQDQHLYVTLSRNRNEVRQSAQVVLAQVDWSTAMRLDLIPKENAAGLKRIELVLTGELGGTAVSLQLTLPFLDYVVMRHFGEIGKSVESAYLQRLERFKAQIQKLASTPREKITLVRLKTDHTFRRQYYSISDGKLEVNDVL